MASSASEIQTIIDNIDTEIETLIASPAQMISYKIGDKVYNRKDRIQELRILRVMYQERLMSIPAEHVGDYDIDETEFGVDKTYYQDSSDD